MKFIIILCVNVFLLIVFIVVGIQENLFTGDGNVLFAYQEKSMLIYNIFIVILF